MTIDWQEQVRPGAALRKLVKEATAALISMDTQRLDELARCCADLNRELQETGGIAEVVAELQDVADDMKLLKRVLFETRANLTVLSRLRVIRLRERCAPVADNTNPQNGRDILWQGSEGRVAYGDN
jgi:hypothetical protein